MDTFPRQWLKHQAVIYNSKREFIYRSSQGHKLLQYHLNLYFYENVFIHNGNKGFTFHCSCCHVYILIPFPSCCCITIYVHYTKINLLINISCDMFQVLIFLNLYTWRCHFLSSLYVNIFKRKKHETNICA